MKKSQKKNQPGASPAAKKEKNKKSYKRQNSINSNEKQSLAKKRDLEQPPAVNAPKRQFIGRITDSPMWSRFNPYILKGYRINYDTC